MIRLSLLISLLVAAGIADLIHARDPWLEPFHENSIWNHPIGSDARLVHAGFTAQANFDVDQEIHLRVSDADPSVEIHVPGSWENRWPGTHAPWQGRMNLPALFTLEDAAPPQTPNNSSAFLMPDNATLVQLAPLTRVAAGAHVVGYRSPNVYLYGMGELGSHSGSNLSGFGGSIRPHEWGPDQAITHALKINVQASKFLYYDSSNKGFRWPATTADRYADGHYRGSRIATRMGALVTFLPGTSYSDIGGISTWQGKKIFDAIYRYGAYITEDTLWDAHAICAERSVNIPISDAVFRAEMNRIFENLHVVDNNSATHVGGGGTLRAPKKPALGPPIGAKITLRAEINKKFVTAGPAGWDFLIASQSGARTPETFEVVDAGHGYIALKSLLNNRYVTVSNDSNILIASNENASSWEHFSWKSIDGGRSIALKARKNGLYVSAPEGGAQTLRANGKTVGDHEKFSPAGGTGSWTNHGSDRYLNLPAF